VISLARLADVFVDVADTMVADFDLLDFLSNLTDHAAEVSGADAVGLVLADHRNNLRFMAASNESGKALELFQLAASEGPCQDCFRECRPVVNADLGEAADLWPTFAPAARAAGFRSVHAFPMRLRGEAIGALNLFSRDPSTFAPDEVRIVQAMADVATIAILQERALGAAEVLSGHLQSALNSRVVIEQAKGALAQAEGISVDEAFVILRHRARSTQRRLVDVAAEVLGAS
jgi:GAF domain-containing protein